MRAASFRISAVVVAAVSALVVPATSASAWALPGGRAPVVTQAGTSNPVTACATGPERPWVRSTTPTLRATLSDADGQAVSATFVVLDSRARIVWAPPAAAPQASGLQHAVTVPEGRLTDGGTYTWLVTGRDAGGRWGLPKLCQFSVDVAAPALAVITPVAGEPAVYAEDASAGGVSVRGSFTLTDESTDVVSYLYSFDGSQQSVTGAAPTISYTPTTSGPHTLEVQAVDRAGNTGPSRLYRFTVAEPVVVGAGGRWLLDEGTGDVATGTGAPLTLTGSTTWTDGLLAELADEPSDRALLFDSPADGAAAAGPVVDTTQPFTVSAFVRVDSLGTHGAAVSQDGSATSAFTLGYDTTGCDEGVPACWTFATGGDESVTRSAGAVQAGSWVHLTGTYDAAGGSIALYVCEIGTADAPGDFNPVTGGPVGVAVATPSAGPFRLGQGFAGAAPFAGTVSSVSVVQGAVASMSSVRVACGQGA